MKGFVTHVAAALTAFALFLALALVLGSSLFLRPQTITYWKDDDGQWYATLVRETPYGAIQARVTAEELSIPASQMECHPFTMPRDGYLYQKIPPTPDGGQADTVTYRLDPGLVPCLEQGARPVIARIAWQVLLFDFLPLRPVRLVQEVQT